MITLLVIFLSSIRWWPSWQTFLFWGRRHLKFFKRKVCFNSFKVERSQRNCLIHKDHPPRLSHMRYFRGGHLCFKPHGGSSELCFMLRHSNYILTLYFLFLFCVFSVNRFCTEIFNIIIRFRLNKYYFTILFNLLLNTIVG